MKTKRIFLFLYIVLVAVASVVFAEPLLQDQFGNELDIGKVLSQGSVVLLHSDERDATELLKYLSELVGSGVRVIAVADLSALPFFVPKKAVVESLKKDEPTLPIFLDFKGLLKKKEGFSSGSLARVYKAGRGGNEYRVDKKSKNLDLNALTSLKNEIATQ